MKKTLVTGSSGFLGHFLVKELIKKGVLVYEAHSKNCDLKNPDSLHQFNGQKFDCIFHLAAWTQAGDFCLKHMAEQWLINQKINTNAVDYWIQKQPQALFVAIGTSCAYDPTLPLIEENYFQGIPIDSLFTYAMTKRILLAGLLAASKQYGLNFLYLVPSTLYGPSYHTDGRQLHFIFDLMRKILNGINLGEKVVLWGDGEQKREVVHVEDFVKAMLLLIEKGEKNTLYNVGAGFEHSIKEFAHMICRIVGYDAKKIEYDLTKYVGARSKVLNIDKLQKALPDFTTCPLEKGLAETIEWFAQSRHMLSQDAPKRTFASLPG